MRGVRFSKGMTVSIPQISLRFREDGEIESVPIVLHLRFDVCPTWIRLANLHLGAAKSAQAKRQAAWAGADEDTRTRLLEYEFEASMQAIVSAAIAWDALYSVLRQHVEVPPAMADRWRNGRTGRYTQVAEVVRRAFALNPKGVAALRANLKEIYRCRDRAVHPSGKLEPALLHPELDVGVEWRLAFFRASNAELVVSVATAMLWDLAENAKAKDIKISEYQKVLSTRLKEVLPEGRPVVPIPVQ